MPLLTFLGAARTVTGSKYLLETDQARVLVDVGLFQGLREHRERNWKPLPVPIASLDAVVLTHAHLDHTGYLPRLVAQGFRGRVFCTPGTADLCRVVLPDAGRLQEEDARTANKYRYSKHDPALPLFTEADAFRAVTQLQPLGYHRAVTIADGLDVEFINAGHLLGSAYASLTLRHGGTRRTVLFGGDLGRYDRPVLPDPSPPPAADVLLVESTYGDRVHEPDHEGADLSRIVRETADRGGKLIVPAFALGRVEEVLYWLKKLEEEKRIPMLPVFLDSPMAIDALRYYSLRAQELDADARPAARDLCAFCTRRFKTVASTQESKELTASKIPSIIVSSSGMATGGRVLHHLKAALPDERNTVLFVGYQATGTRGRKLIDGAGTVRIHGVDVPVAARIEKVDSMSAHADSSEILRWLSGFERRPETTFLVHGEPAPMDALKATMERRLGWTGIRTPDYMEQVEI